MRIILTAHAALMMNERKIALEWIERTLAEPEADEPDALREGVRRSFRAIPERESRILRVAYTRDGDTCRVITAFLDRGRSR
jgi:hypothetical protein